ncbi:MAG: fructoselysine 6-kinase [Lachnospiraceae bacterium]|nr:fructoselysine 6-kinase [Lachnospiraceae bacterium]
MKLACVGDCCIDYYDESGKGFPGGNAVNTAVYFRRLGGEASYTGPVGQDSYGEQLRAALLEKGVDISHLKTVPGKTAVTHVKIQNGNRVFGAYEEGVMADFRPSAEDVDFLCSHDLAAAVLWGHAEDALKEIHARGVPVSYDASDTPFHETALSAAPYTTLFFFSDDKSDTEGLKEKMKTIFRLGPSAVIATRGNKGSLAFDGTGFEACEAPDVPVVDTLGAGDSYIAGFLKSWLEKKPLKACMEEGTRNAAITIGYTGAWQQ